MTKTKNLKDMVHSTVRTVSSKVPVEPSVKVAFDEIYHLIEHALETAAEAPSRVPAIVRIRVVQDYSVLIFEAFSSSGKLEESERKNLNSELQPKEEALRKKFFKLLGQRLEEFGFEPTEGGTHEAEVQLRLALGL